MASSKSAWVVEKDLVHKARKDSQPMEKEEEGGCGKILGGSRQGFCIDRQHTFRGDIRVTHTSLDHREMSQY